MNRRGRSRGASYRGHALYRGDPRRFRANTFIMWLRSDLGITIATGVSQWNDLSGMGNHVTQGTAGSQPLFVASGGSNGRPYVQADGTDDFMQKTAIAFSQPVNVFAVGKWDSAFAANSTLIDGIGGNTMRFFRTGDTTAALFAGAQLNATGMTPLAWHSLELFFRGTSSYIKEDAVTRAGPDNAGTGSSTGVTLFAFGSGAADFAAASVSELILYNTDLAASAQARVRGYLRARYGLT